MATTPEECVDALRHAARKLGESPTKAQYEELGLQPASATVIRTMGGWNEAKRRTGLEAAPSTGSRTGPMPEGLEFTEEEWAAMSVDQRWHYRNAEWNTERTLRRRARIRRWINEYKRESGGCARCAEVDPVCIDFHHPDGSDKELSVNRLVQFGYARGVVRAEMDKCVPLCANCHQKEHFAGLYRPEGEPLSAEEPTSGIEPRNRRGIRRWSIAYRRASGCRECGVTDPRCLQFHHVDTDEKVRGVGRMISDGYSRQLVVEEVSKCVVLCANCHRKEHDSV